MKRSLRTCLSLVILLVLVPLTVYLCARADRKYYLSGLVIILLTLAAFFLRFESRRPQARGSQNRQGHGHGYLSDAGQVLTD